MLSLAVLIGPATAQDTRPAGYLRALSDTLRYVELTESVNTMSGRGGDFEATTVHDATLAVTFGSADSALAWYETLALSSTSPRGTFEPVTDPMIGEPFVLLLDARGRVRTLATPPFPESVSAITDLTRQFDDFFVRLPAAELVVGLAWTDTVMVGDSSSVENWNNFTSFWELRVLGDTVVNGIDASVIEGVQVIRTQSVGPVQGEDLLLRLDLQGEEHSVFVFAPVLGRMLSRVRNGELRGTMQMANAQSTVRLSHAYSYTGSIRLVN